MSVVADASPIIALARIGRLDLLPRLYQSIDIPRAVLAELVRRPLGVGVASPPWLRARDVQNGEAMQGLRQSLDPHHPAAVILSEPHPHPPGAYEMRALSLSQPGPGRDQDHHHRPTQGR